MFRVKRDLDKQNGGFKISIDLLAPHSTLCYHISNYRMW